MSKKRSVLITGASSGIGQAMAQLLAQKDFSVFGTSRNPSRNEPLYNITILPLDVRSDESVKTCVDTVIKQAGHLDVLINNAGYVLAGAIEEITLEEAKDLFETNFFGVMRMVKTVLPIMRGQSRGQIINISSLAGLNPIPFAGLYGASKFALEGYTEALRYELNPLNIRVSLVEPGFVKTNVGSNKQIGSNTIPDYHASRQRALDRLGVSQENGAEPKVIAEKVLRIIQSKSPRLRHLVGKEAIYYRLRQCMPETMFERAARNFWCLDGGK